MPGVLCLLAHPDDEIFCAGLLARLTDQHVPLHLVCMTRGEGGGLGDPPRATRDTLGAVREQEMTCSARVLGADSLDFLDYVDPSPVGDLKAPAHNADHLIEEIRALIERYAPDLVLTHGSNGDYGHPAHKLLHRMVKSAVVATNGDAPSMYSFNAFHPSLPQPGILNDDDWADLVIDVSSVLETKVSVLECHATQWQVFVDRQDSTAEYKSAIAEYMQSFSKESYCCHGPNEEKHSLNTLSVWLGIEPDPLFRRYVNAVGDTLLQYKHRARIRLRTLVRALRNSLRSS